MLKVTGRALEAIASALDANQVQAEQALRLARNDEGGFGLAVDEQREGDEVVAHGERPVLFIEPDVSVQLDGVTLDLMESPQGRRLTLTMQEEA
jgi:Fe-S cluster assembly iron-binding protein IscA